MEPAHVTLFSTIFTAFAAIATLAYGRYLERKKEVELHLRDKKIQLYSDFLNEFWKMFQEQERHGKGAKREKDLIRFLKDFQKKLIIWSGPNVILSYVGWMEHLTKGVPDAQTIYLMDKFFKEMRSDIGLSNKKLEKGIFASFQLQNFRFFLNEARKNPNITLDQFAALEQNLHRN